MRIKYLFGLYIVILFLLIVIIFEIFIKKKNSPDPPAPQNYIVPQSATSTNLLQSDQSGNMSIMNLDNIVLVGQISYFAFNFLASDPNPPPRYLICDGSEISRTTYSNLFNVIGITFGSGNGTSTFNIPDLRGMFIRGYDPTGNIDKDRNKTGFGTTQQDTIQNITGNVASVIRSWDFGRGKFDGVFESSNTDSDIHVQSGNGGGYGSNVNFDASKSPGARTSTETRPKNVALLACIRF
jgi:phage-related tail fiber protein